MDNKELRQRINLIKELAITDFKLRYQGSALGYLWSFLRPLFNFLVLYLIFSVFMRFQVDYYQVYLFLGIILWAFFAECTSAAMKSMTEKSGILKKIYFPRIIIVISSTITSLLTLFLNLAVFAIFFFFSGARGGWAAVLLPVFLIYLYFFSLGISLFLTSFFAKFRDLAHIWEVALQLGFWLTPIFYTIGMVPQKYHFALYANPMTRIIQYLREAVIYDTFPNLDGMVALSVGVIFFFLVGYFTFRKREKYIVEEL